MAAPRPINHRALIKFKVGRMYKITEGMWDPDPDPYKNIAGYIVREINEDGFPTHYSPIYRNPYITVAYVNKYGDRFPGGGWSPYALHYENGVAYFISSGGSGSSYFLDRVFATRDVVIPVTKPVVDDTTTDFEKSLDEDEFPDEYKYAERYFREIWGEDDEDHPFSEHMEGPPKT